MVSCICVTHNRVEFLKKSIEYFNRQTYSRRQLIVLFEKDPLTKAFIENNLNKYNFLKINEEINNLIEDLIIKPCNEKVKVIEHITEGEICYIWNSKEEKYLALNNCIFSYTDEPSETSIFTLHKEKDGFLLKNNEGVCLIKDSEGNFQAQLAITNAVQWELCVLTNNTFKIIHSTELLDRSDLNLIGWELEMVNDVKSNIIFCELNATHAISLGAKRNLTINISDGEYICVWDDDDIYSDNRIADQMRFLKFSNRDACTLNTEVFIDNHSGQFYISPPRSEGWENSLLCKKSVMGFYDNLARKEDTPVLYRLWEEHKLCVMDDPNLYLYNIHASNVSGNSHFENLFKWSQKLSKDEMLEIKTKFNLV